MGLQGFGSNHLKVARCWLDIGEVDSFGRIREVAALNPVEYVAASSVLRTPNSSNGSSQEGVG